MNRDPVRPPDDVTELVAHVARRAERLAIALGLPREAKYTVLSALGADAIMPELAPHAAPRLAAQALPQPTPSQPAFVLEIARGAAHVAQFVRSFLAGQTPPAFQLSPVAIAVRGRGAAAPGEGVAGTAGPVSIALTEDHARHEVVLTAQLQGTAIQAAAVRLYRGYEGAETPLALITTLHLSVDAPEQSHRLSSDAFEVLHLEVDPG